MWPDFMGAVAFNRIARFMADPRDQRKTPEYFEVVGTEEGIFGCLGSSAAKTSAPRASAAGPTGHIATKDGMECGAASVQQTDSLTL